MGQLNRGMGFFNTLLDTHLGENLTHIKTERVKANLMRKLCENLYALLANKRLFTNYNSLKSQQQKMHSKEEKIRYTVPTLRYMNGFT